MIEYNQGFIMSLQIEEKKRLKSTLDSIDNIQNKQHINDNIVQRNKEIPNFGPGKQSNRIDKRKSYRKIHS